MQVVRVQAGLLGRALEEVFGVMDDVLVHGRRRGDQDRDARALTAAGSPELLPGRGHGPRVAREAGRIEAPDVHAQFQGVGGDDPQDLAITQAALDGPALCGQVAAPVATHSFARPEALPERFPEACQE